MELSKQIIKIVKETDVSFIELMGVLKNQVIMTELERNGFNITATAEALNIKRTTLQEILRRQGLNKVQAALKFEGTRT